MKQLKPLGPKAARRFATEVRLLSSLEHPRVIEVVDSDLSGNRPFYVMPRYVHSLQDEIGTISADITRVAMVCQQVLEGISYAHDQGVVHRDIKPGNVLVDSRGDVVVSDFGLGRQLSAEETRMTSTGEVMGTMLYMAPELFQDFKHCDQKRSDVYSLGRLLIHLFCGSLVPGPQPLDQIPGPIRAVANRATQQEADSRYDNAGEMLRAFRRAASAAGNAASLDALDRVLTRLSVDPNPSAELLHQLVSGLVACLGDEDRLHDAIMNLRPEVLAEAVTLETEAMRAVLKLFCDFTSRTGWGFDYTDKIAAKLASTHALLDDPGLRGVLLECVVEVGAGHNRWYVMTQAGKMLERVDPFASDDVEAHVNALAAVNEHYIERVRAYVSVKDIPATLAAMFAD